ncbi:prepilin-type N-terminal cleavage/methylation domain-containing protein [bacterium]|nr:prepilin-type N-terminal cleavage/methylation domain-containing protein [bacterium]
MLKKLFKEQKGFTLIEVLIVVVIVAILAAISVPIYLQYVEQARASDAMATIGAIYNSCKMYYQDHSEDAADVDILQEQGYLEIDPSTLKQWNFTVIGSNPITQIEAISLPDMRGGAGRRVTYNVETGIFEGYGLPSEGESSE